MKKSITLFYIFAHTLHLAWGQNSYELYLKNKPYTPEVNIDQLINEPWLFTAKAQNNYWYGVLQFYAVPASSDLELLKSLGMLIEGYLPQSAYLVKVPVSFNLSLLKTLNARCMVELLPNQKMDSTLWNYDIPESAKEGNHFVKITLQLFSQTPKNIYEDQLLKHGAIIVNEENKLFNNISIIAPIDSIQKLATIPSILWMEPTSPDAESENVPGKNLHRSNVLNDGFRKLTGENVRIGVWDGGTIGPHLDFAGRLTLVQTTASDDHATHVTGTMAGAGVLNPTSRGMAPRALIFGYDFNGSVNSEITSSIATHQIVISQHSWGMGSSFVNCTSRDPYNLNSREQDIILYNNPNYSHIHSAGNSQSVCTGGWGTTTGKAAKNTLVVANVDAGELINNSSSFGPVQDGRIKPEISAVGVNVFSTTPNNTYTGGYTGTSMATPGVSGTVAQLYELYRRLNGNANPTSAVIKAVVCNSAKDIGNPGPDYKHGYGLINGLRASKAIEQNRFMVNSISQGVTQSVSLSIPSGVTRVKVTLCWNDVPALANANPALVNDLDLTITAPNSITYTPWILNPALPNNNATAGIDRMNNTEQISIQTPIAGSYTINITGFTVPIGPQQYAISWEVEQPFTELTFPNGNEALIPGNTYAIHWDNAGNSNTQTVQYSLNGGSTWVNISSSVAATANQVNWTIPTTINSSQAIVRVSSGVLQDVSDLPFNIIRIPTGLSVTTNCSGNGATVTWSAVTGATHYDIVGLDSSTGLWDTLAVNITSTRADLLTLTPNRTYWIAIIAKNNTLNVIGERSTPASYSFIPSGPQVGIMPVSSSNTVVCSGNTTTLSTTAGLRKSPLANYTFTSSSNGVLDPMGNSSVIIGSNVDNIPTSTPIAIGFTFNLNESDYSFCNISPDGWISLGNNVASAEPTNSITSALNIPKIFPYWDDLSTGNNGNVKIMLTGSAPSRIFIVEWLVTIPKNVSGAANSTFQLWLHETSNRIEFRYGTMGTTTTASASSGIAINSTTFRSITFSSNTQSTTTANNTNTSPPTTNRMYTFLLPSITNLSWFPSTFLNTTAGGTVIASNINTTTNYRVVATHTNGCTDTAYYNVLVNPKPVVGFRINTSTQPINTNSFVYTDTIAGIGNGRVWEFGDGTLGNSNPAIKTYASTGTFQVKLKITTPTGCSDSLQRSITVLSASPTVYASNLVFSNITQTTNQLSWVNGNGSQRIVIASAGSPINSLLLSGTNYTANSQFGQGSMLPDGSYIIFKGTSNTVTVTGLTPGINYQYAVVEMNNDGATSSYQPLPYLTGTNTTLPVSWLAFTGKYLNENEVQLDWTTASETNNRQFAVALSIDGNNWTEIGYVNGNGTVNSLSNYRFIHKLQLAEKNFKKLYYRLKQVDFDGRFEYSDYITVYLPIDAPVCKIYPNPFSDQILITNQEPTPMEIVIEDIQGLILHKESNVQSGHTLSLKELPQGIYFMKIFMQDEQKTIKLLKE